MCTIMYLKKENHQFFNLCANIYLYREKNVLTFRMEWIKVQKERKRQLELSNTTLLRNYNC
jgi:hypothetical protein